jgi:hypothetical protein
MQIVRRSVSVRRTALIATIAALALVASGCYTNAANQAAENGTPVPWFCNPIAENSVTGPGMGTTNYYAGVTRAPLSYDDCKKVGPSFDLAKAYAKQYPTLGAAKAAGMRNGFDFIPGMGTHTGFGMSPALLADPSFNPQDPIFPNSNMDGVFDPAVPEFLQYNGNSDDAVLVGLDYYVRTTNGLPPAGFPGNNDWWHHHPQLCVKPATGTAFLVNATDQACASQGGINLHMQKYFMLHVWLVDNLEYLADVHAPMHPCIKGTGAIFNLGDPCQTSLLPGAGAGAAAKGTAGFTPAKEETSFCPIGTLSATA